MKKIVMAGAALAISVVVLMAGTALAGSAERTATDVEQRRRRRHGPRFPAHKPC